MTGLIPQGERQPIGGSETGMMAAGTADLLVARQDGIVKQQLPQCDALWIATLKHGRLSQVLCSSTGKAQPGTERTRPADPLHKRAPFSGTQACGLFKPALHDPVSRARLLTAALRQGRHSRIGTPGSSLGSSTVSDCG